MYQHVMLDVETLGVKHNAVTFQVGALAFNEANDVTVEFSLFINPQDQITQLGSTTDESTINWWKTQPLWPEMERRMNELAEDSVRLSSFQKRYREFLYRYTGRNTKFWANGICFDIPKIEHLLGGEFCKFWNIMDFRTMKNMFPNVGLPPGDYGPAHDALADCRSQAAHLKAIMEKIRGPVA